MTHHPLLNFLRASAPHPPRLGSFSSELRLCSLSSLTVSLTTPATRRYTPPPPRHSLRGVSPLPPPDPFGRPPRARLYASTSAAASLAPSTRSGGVSRVSFGASVLVRVPRRHRDAQHDERARGAGRVPPARSAPFRIAPPSGSGRCSRRPVASRRRRAPCRPPRRPTRARRSPASRRLGAAAARYIWGAAGRCSRGGSSSSAAAKTLNPATGRTRPPPRRSRSSHRFAHGEDREEARAVEAGVAERASPPPRSRTPRGRAGTSARRGRPSTPRPRA